MSKPQQRDAACLLIAPYGGIGDLVFHTPTIRVLSQMFRHLDVTAKNPEPFLNSPRIREFLLVPESATTIEISPNKYKHIVSSYGVLLSDLVKDHSRIHTVDQVSLNALGTVLRNSEKDLEIFWTAEDEAIVQGILHQKLTGLKDGPLVVVSPAITWPSRTFPLPWWKTLIEKLQDFGAIIILSGKNIFYESKVDIPKTLWPAIEFPGAVDLYGQLSLNQLAYLYSQVDVAINGETVTNPVSTCNPRCWNIYLPTLTAPEFRVPWREGRQDYKTIVVGNDQDYYPASAYWEMIEQNIAPMNAAVKFPSTDAVIEAYKHVIKAILHQ